jgi:hypothetical protein
VKNNFNKKLNKEKIKTAYYAGVYYGSLQSNKTAWQCYTEWADNNNLLLISTETLYYFNQFEFGFNNKQNFLLN